MAVDGMTNHVTRSVLFIPSYANIVSYSEAFNSMRLTAY